MNNNELFAHNYTFLGSVMEQLRQHFEEYCEAAVMDDYMLENEEHALYNLIHMLADTLPIPD